MIQFVRCIDDLHDGDALTNPIRIWASRLAMTVDRLPFLGSRVFGENQDKVDLLRIDDGSETERKLFQEKISGLMRPSATFVTLPVIKMSNPSRISI